MRRPRVVPAPALVLGAIASVQSGAAVATRLFPVTGAGGAAFLRLALGAVLVVAFARPRWAIDDRLAWAAAYGVILAAMNLTFYEALTRIPLGIAVTFEFMGPLLVAVVGSRNPFDVMWVVLAGVGVVLLSIGAGHLDALGVTLALVAGGFWACYILVAQQVGRRLPGATGLAIALVVGTVVTAPFGIASAGARIVRPGILGRGLAVALLSSAIPYSLELAALRRIRSAVFGVLMSLEPAFAALSGLLFLSQHLRLREWIAILLVVVASVGATRGSTAPAEVVAA